MTNLAETRKILGDLIAFPTISGRPNGDIIDYVRTYFASIGTETHIDPHADGERFNLFATFGPESDGGIVLSSHLDVVPAEVEGWLGDPFVLREDGSRLIGRGTVDMKGFLACILAMAPRFKAIEADLRTPLHFALTFDEEVGCYGAAQFRGFLDRLGIHPQIAIIGEPTEMKPYVGHKAIIELTTEIRGSSGHAADPRDKANALYFASRFISRIEEMARECARRPQRNSAFDPPFTTLNVGQITGGEGRNIIPDFCRFLWEIRPIPTDNGRSLLQDIQHWIDETLLPEMQAVDPESAIETIELADCPGMEARPNSSAMQLIGRLWTNAAPGVLSFSTDGGYFQQYGMETVVFGPGQMTQMHQPEEYILTSEIEECLEFLTRFSDYMTTDAAS